MTALAVPLIQLDSPLAQQVSAARAAGADLIELRVDLLGDSAAIAELLEREQESRGDAPYLLTIRSAAEGGGWDGGDDERVALYERLGLLQPGYLDVEWATWQRSANLRQKIGLVAETGAEPGTRAKNRLILSWHELRETPADLAARLDPFDAPASAIRKAVFTTRDAFDGWRIADELRRRGAGAPWILLGMGEGGLLTRVLAKKFGGFLTFAALDEDSLAAPGQPTIATLRELYRWDALGPATGVYGVVGWPVAHSQSPRLHNAAMARAGIDGVYLPMPILPERERFVAFMDFLAARPELGVRGLSVTIPHKEHALQWLRERGGAISDIALRCGAVNTLQCDRGRWSGDNTDAAGALRALQGLTPGRAHVLGAGGAARAVIAALQTAGWQVRIYGRDARRTAEVARELGCEWRIWEERARTRCDLLANCTQVGMSPNEDESPYPAAALRKEMTVFDTVYQPEQTRLLRAAADCGAAVRSGLTMFRAQAALQFECWHGRAMTNEA